MSNPEAVGHITPEGTFRGVYVHWGLGLDQEFDLSLITDLGEGDDPLQIIDEMVDEGVEFSDIAIPRLFGEGRPSPNRFIIEGFPDKLKSTEDFVRKARKMGSSVPVPTPKPDSGTPADVLRTELRRLPYVNGIWILEKIDQQQIDSAKQEYKELYEAEDWDTLDEVGDEFGCTGDEVTEDMYLGHILAEGGLYSDGYAITYHQTSI